MYINQFPLHHAVEVQNEQLVRLLIEARVNVNSRNEDGETPLHVLVARDWGNNGYVPMNDAEKQRRQRIANILIRAGADVNSQRRIDLGCDLATYASILYEAAYFNNLPMIEVLLSHGANVNSVTSTGFTVLHKVIEMNDCDINIVKILLIYGCNVNAVYPGRRYGHHGGTALHLALARDDCSAELVELLLEHGADVYLENDRGLNAVQNYLLSAADLYTNSWRLRGINPALLRMIPPSEKDVSPLHQACIFNDFDYVRELAMQPHVDINARDSLGNSPLFYAVISQSDSVEDQIIKIEGCGCILDIATRLRFRARKICKVLIQHAAKLVEMNSGDERMVLNKFNLRVLHSYEPIEWTGMFNEFDTRHSKQNYLSCIKELREMKRNKIGDTKITFFDLLIADEKKAIVYAKNKQIAAAFARSFAEDKFPIYQESMLYTNFGNAYERQKLLQLASVVLVDTLCFADPTDVYIVNTLAKMSNKDLRTLILDAEAAVSLENSYDQSLDYCYYK